jgi:hypothetical protein
MAELYPSRPPAPDSTGPLHQRQLSLAASAESFVSDAQPKLNDEDAGSHPLPQACLVKIKPRRELTWWDVSALIINKMIGTGIFTGPPTVLMYTGRKDTALYMWAAGFVYTLVRLVRRP